jgi:hypothetical protein
MMATAWMHVFIDAPWSGRGHATLLVGRYRLPRLTSLMAKTTITRITDDVDGSGEAQTVIFGIDGKRHEVDLSSKNRKALDKALH